MIRPTAGLLALFLRQVKRKRGFAEGYNITVPGLQPDRATIFLGAA
jgi:hypothetical protein